MKNWYEVDCYKSADPTCSLETRFTCNNERTAKRIGKEQLKKYPYVEVHRVNNEECFFICSFSLGIAL